MNKVIPLVFSFNKKYIPYAKVALNSIFKRSSSKIKLYCFGLDLQDSDFDYFKNLAVKFGAEFESHHFYSNQLDHFRDIHYLTKTTYLRLFIPEIVKEDKVIYSDCDVIFLEDITELYDMPLDDDYVLAAQDWAYDNQHWHPFDRPEKLDLTDTYVNCGIMVLNNKALKNIDFQGLCTSINNKYKEVLTCADQCILNKLFEGKKKILSNGWNFQFLAHANNLDHILPMSVIHSIGENKIWMQDRSIPRNFDFWVSEALSYGLTKEEIGVE